MDTGHFSTPTDFPHVQLFFFFQISFSVYQDTSSQMADQMNQAIDVFIPWMDEVDGSEDEDDEKIIDISGYKTNVRPLYLIKRQKDIATTIQSETSSIIKNIQYICLLCT
jgi:hypothetical protein